MKKFTVDSSQCLDGSFNIINNNIIGISSIFKIDYPRKLEKFLLISKQDQSYFDDFIRTVDDVDKFRSDYPNLMYYACLTIGSMSSIKSLKTLIDMKYDVNYIDGIPFTPLHLLCMGINLNRVNNIDSFNALKMLIEAKADLNYKPYSKSSLIDIITTSFNDPENTRHQLNLTTIKSLLYLNDKGVVSDEEFGNHTTNFIRDLVLFDADSQRNRSYMLEHIRLHLYNKTDLCPDLINEIVKFL
jgi:hypothetical protein